MSGNFTAYAPQMRVGSEYQTRLRATRLNEECPHYTSSMIRREPLSPPPRSSGEADRNKLIVAGSHNVRRQSGAEHREGSLLTQYAA